MQVKSTKKSVLIIAILIALIGSLLYYEQVALIFILSNIALIVLLLVVAFADLEKKFGKVSDLETPAETKTGERQKTQKHSPENPLGHTAKTRKEATNLS